MATNLENDVYGYETQLFAPAYGEAPEFYRDDTAVKTTEAVEVRAPMYGTDSVALGMPMYMGGTVSRPQVTFVETGAGV